MKPFAQGVAPDTGTFGGEMSNIPADIARNLGQESWAQGMSNAETAMKDYRPVEAVRHALSAPLAAAYSTFTHLNRGLLPQSVSGILPAFEHGVNEYTPNAVENPNFAEITAEKLGEIVKYIAELYPGAGIARAGALAGRSLAGAGKMGKLVEGAGRYLGRAGQGAVQGIIANQAAPWKESEFLRPAGEGAAWNTLLGPVDWALGKVLSKVGVPAKVAPFLATPSLFGAMGAYYAPWGHKLEAAGQEAVAGIIAKAAHTGAGALEARYQGLRERQADKAELNRSPGGWSDFGEKTRHAEGPGQPYYEASPYENPAAVPEDMKSATEFEQNQAAEFEQNQAKAAVPTDETSKPKTAEYMAAEDDILQRHNAEVARINKFSTLKGKKETKADIEASALRHKKELDDLKAYYATKDMPLGDRKAEVAAFARQQAEATDLHNYMDAGDDPSLQKLKEGLLSLHEDSRAFTPEFIKAEWDKYAGQMPVPEDVPLGDREAEATAFARQNAEATDLHNYMQAGNNPDLQKLKADLLSAHEGSSQFTPDIIKAAWDKYAGQMPAPEAVADSPYLREMEARLSALRSVPQIGNDYVPAVPNFVLQGERSSLDLHNRMTGVGQPKQIGLERGFTMNPPAEPLGKGSTVRALEAEIERLRKQTPIETNWEAPNEAYLQQHTASGWERPAGAKSPYLRRIEARLSALRSALPPAEPLDKGSTDAFWEGRAQDARIEELRKQPPIKTDAEALYEAYLQQHKASGQSERDRIEEMLRNFVPPPGRDKVPGFVLPKKRPSVAQLLKASKKDFEVEQTLANRKAMRRGQVADWVREFYPKESLKKKAEGVIEPNEQTEEEKAAGNFQAESSGNAGTVPPPEEGKTEEGQQGEVKYTKLYAGIPLDEAWKLVKAGGALIQDTYNLAKDWANLHFPESRAHREKIAAGGRGAALAQEVGQGVRGGASVAVDIYKELHVLFSPATVGKMADKATTILRGVLNGRPANEIDKRVQSMLRIMPNIFQMGGADRDAFNIEHASGNVRPEWKTASDFIKMMDDLQVADLKSLPRTAYMQFRENYLRQMWKLTPELQKVLGDTGQRMTGTSWQRPRTLTYAEGIAKGLTPMYDSLGEQLIHDWTNKQEYISKMRAFEMLGKTPLFDGSKQMMAIQVKSSKEIPEGYVRLKTPLAEDKKTRSFWVMPEEVARLVDNRFSTGFEKSPIFRAYRSAGNFLNSIQLGISGFHATMTVLSSVYSDLANSMMQVKGGDYGGAIESLLRMPRLISKYKYGKQVWEEMLSPGTHPELSEITNLMINGGFTRTMSAEYRLKQWDKMIMDWKGGKLLSAAARVIPALAEKAASPIMEHLVPALKASHAARRIRIEMDLHPDATPEQRAEAVRNIIDTIENRFGQLNYDNIFWSTGFKQLLMASTRAVGWNHGTLREIGGGVIDPFINNGFTDRSAFVIAMIAGTAVLGALTQFIFTQKLPDVTTIDGLKDLYYPKDGTTDENGNPNRLAFPTYTKDLFAYAKDIRRGEMQTIVHKVHPMLSLAFEIASNSNYYGTKVRNEDDPLNRRIAAITMHVLKSLVPFSFRGAAKNLEGGLTDRTMVTAPLSMMGLLPAPRSINMTAAQAKMKDYEKSYTNRTTEQAEQSRKLYNLSKLAKNSPEEYKVKLAQELQAGNLSKGDIGNLKERITVPPLVRGLGHLDIAQALNVWDKMTDKEKKETYAVMLHKFQLALQNSAPAKRQDILKRYQRFVARQS
jgi:hypothetical protein